MISPDRLKVIKSLYSVGPFQPWNFGSMKIE